MKIAIVGGSGFIGTYLTARFVSADHDVRIVDKRRSHAYPELTIEADVRNPAALERALQGCDALYNLAAEHKDNVLPKALYKEVNVGGARNICSVAGDLGINRIIFTSSVAVYGFAPANTDEEGAVNPFNEYGRTKLRAEWYYHEWQASDPRRSLAIVRPTVVFGPRNRGNVYTLLRQMSSGRFVMVGPGSNVKSMAYVENVAAFLEFLLTASAGAQTYNYVDKPDLDMNSLVQLVRQTLGLSAGLSIRLPYTIGYAGGLFFDAVAAVTRRELPISAIRVKKFCATTQFCSVRLASTGFVPPVSLKDGLARTLEYEFLGSAGRADGEETVFDTE